MNEMRSHADLVACCGLYCGACRSYQAEKCPGCHEHHQATWCKIRTCCREKGISTCAGCASFPDPKDCRKFNNPIAKVFALVFRSDRAACIRQIRTLGIQGHADDMSQHGRHTIKR